MRKISLSIKKFIILFYFCPIGFTITGNRFIKVSRYWSHSDQLEFLKKEFNAILCCAQIGYIQLK